MKFSGLLIEGQRKIGGGRLLTYFVVPVRDEDLAVSDILAVLAEGYVVALNNDLDEGHEGVTELRITPSGLEMMTSGELTAIIPVNENVAKAKGWVKIPLPDLVKRLKKIAAGRVLQSDDLVESAGDLSKLRPKDVDPNEWKRFTDRVAVTKDYFDFSL